MIFQKLHECIDDTSSNDCIPNCNDCIPNIPHESSAWSVSDFHQENWNAECQRYQPDDEPDLEMLKCQHLRSDIFEFPFYAISGQHLFHPIIRQPSLEQLNGFLVQNFNERAASFVSKSKVERLNRFVDDDIGWFPLRYKWFLMYCNDLPQAILTALFSGSATMSKLAKLWE